MINHIDMKGIPPGPGGIPFLSIRLQVSNQMHFLLSAFTSRIKLAHCVETGSVMFARKNDCVDVDDVLGNMVNAVARKANTTVEHTEGKYCLCDDHAGCNHPKGTLSYYLTPTRVEDLSFKSS